MEYNVTPITSDKPFDCGPTCLQMLLAYYGTAVDLETLTRECGVTYMGCSAKDVMLVGRAHGLDMVAFNMDAAELIRQDRPAIVWWKYQHFVVFSGTDENGKVVICNPDLGRYRMTAGTFKAFYSGVSLWNGEPHDLPEE